MEEHIKKSVLNRIETGITFLNIKNSLYSMHMPTKEQKAISELVYRETVEDSKYSELITRAQAENYLAMKGIWTPNNDTELEKLNKYLEDLKIQLYDALFNDKKKKQLRRQIKSIKNGINKSLCKKYSLDHITLENHAETTRDEFLVAISIKDSAGRQVYSYENWSKIDNYILQRFLNYNLNNILSTEQFRELARTEPFRSQWSLHKSNTFGTTQNSPEQITLMMYARMYDNVYEHPEKPGEEVINDDDVLDGWFAKQRREAEAARKKKEIDDILGSKGGKDGAGEMFVVANSAEEARKIRGVNDLASRIKMNQRQAAVGKDGRIEEQNLPDVKMDLKAEAMRQMADRFKR
jgi:hypothetical protein